MGNVIVLAYLVLEFHPAGKGTRRRVILFHVFCKRPMVLVLVWCFHLFFFSPITYVYAILYSRMLAIEYKWKEAGAFTAWTKSKAGVVSLNLSMVDVTSVSVFRTPITVYENPIWLCGGLESPGCMQCVMEKR